MAKVAGNRVKNVVLVGHGGCGKTMLAEAFLYKAGVIKRMGTITDGTTVSDTAADEKERQNSIDSAIMHFPSNGVEINVIDTPGYPDLIGRAVPAMRAADVAAICVSAVSGIEVNTRKMWELAGLEGIVRIVVVTRMDGENADFEKCMADIREAFGPQCRPFLVPDAAGSALTKVTAVLAEGGQDRDGLVESIVEADEALLEKYLEGEDISDDELAGAVSAALKQGSLVPVLCTAAEKGIGIPETAEFIAKFAPDVMQRDLPLAEGAEAPSDGAFTGQVFKLVSDPFVGKLSFLRVFTGSISSSDTLKNLRTGTQSKVGQLLRMQGKEQESVDEAGPGDIVCVAKIDDLQLSDTVVTDDGPAAYAELVCPQPMVSLAVEPKKRGDEGKISGSLDKLAHEDPTFKISRDPQTHEMVVTGMSDLHLIIMLDRLKRRFDVEVDTKEPKIPYKETVGRGAQGHHKHKKQTGGRGQYGEVYLRIAPRARGEGFEFASEVVGGSIPTQYIPAVEKGVREIMVKGILAGYPIEDIEVVVTDGSYHNVDSSEAAFKMAAKKAFRDAFDKAKPCLLEPIVDMQVTAPISHMGSITGDLNSRRGRIMGMDAQGSMQMISAQVPLGEIMKYSAELRSTTGGEGSYSIQLSHYAVVPAQYVAGLIKQKVQDDEEED